VRDVLVFGTVMLASVLPASIRVVRLARVGDMLSVSEYTTSMTTDSSLPGTNPDSISPHHVVVHIIERSSLMLCGTVLLGGE
jgi:hypothetical protein